MTNHEISAEECDCGSSGGAVAPAPEPSPCSVTVVDEFNAQELDNNDNDINIFSTSYEIDDADDDEAMASVHDLVGLTQLDESAILRVLRARYDSGVIYTSTGPILIAINPFRDMDGLYSEDVMERYRREGGGEGVMSGGGSIPTQSCGGSSGSNDNAFSKNNDRAGRVGHDEGSERLPPHAYKAADDAYRAMRRGIENTVLMKGRRRSSGSGSIGDESQAPANQSILVSGESGAGKTVTTKIVLRYFARLSGSIAEEDRRLASRASRFGGSRPSLARGLAGADGGTGVGSRSNTVRRTAAVPSKEGRGTTTVGIEQQVLQSNPILEAFGNARTARNDNSSRFGKYIDVRFSSSGKLAGARIDTYLLEKVRLVRPSEGERNYHVFYQLLEAATYDERMELGLGGLGVLDFKLLNCTGGAVDRRDGVDDRMMHQEMMCAMATIGFDSETISSILRLVTAILHCGNITFEQRRQSDQHSNSDACSVAETHASLTAARLLEVAHDDLAEALTYRDLLAGNEVIHSPLDRTASEKGCEALVKAVYGAAFNFVVERVNESISSQCDFAGNGRDEAEGGGSRGASIGVLDIFGFEIFQNNSYEQLCINYTNEALQQQFNKYVFKIEQTEYEREGINWKWITFPDNQEVLDLIDFKHTGMLALLDEQCIVGSTDAMLARYLYAKCDKHPRFSATSVQRADFKFSINHYAGLVEYSTEQWLEKNNDQLPVGISNLLKGSNFALLSKIRKFIQTENRNGRGSVASASIGAQFSIQLSKLRARIDATVPHYIRCLKPNEAMVPDRFDPNMIVDQLRCGGVLEAVRVSRAGYPTRYLHDVFKARYYILGYGQAKGDKDETCEDSEVKQLIGKIAFNLWNVDREAMMSKKSEVKPCIMAYGVSRPETANEFLSLDFLSRCALAGLQLGRTKVFLRREALDRIEALRARKFGQSALTIQTIMRGVQARAYYKLFRRKMMHFAMVTQRIFRRYMERLYLTPAVIKVQAIFRGAIVRMRSSTQSTTDRQRMWVSYREFEILQMEIKELKSDKATMKYEIESLRCNVADISDARDSESRNLQRELAGKALMQKEMLTKETSANSLAQELDSVRRKLRDAEQAACQEQEQFTSKLSSLETQLLVSEAEKDKLGRSLKSLDEENKVLTNQNQELSKQMKSLMSEVGHTNEIIQHLNIDLDSFKKAACQQEQLGSKNSSLKADLIESKQEEKILLDLTNSLKASSVDGFSSVENQKVAAIEHIESLKHEIEKGIHSRSAEVGYANGKCLSLPSGQEQDQLQAKIIALMANLMECKINEDVQENTILLLKKEYEEYRVSNQDAIYERMDLCESKMEPTCLVDGKDRTFQDMLAKIQKECSDIIAKSKTMARELESSHRINLLSEDASKYELEKGMLQALDEFTNSLVEVELDGEVKKLLISFCHMIKSANAEMSIEVSLL